MKRWLMSEAYQQGLKATRTQAFSAGEPSPAEAQITAWLSRLRLLHGVPFHYLVADQRMLPIESIRFFQADEAWLTALIDGAYSIGRPVTGDVGAAEAERLQQHHVIAIRESAKVRADKLGRSFTESAPVISGFLLRSAVVAGWPNMEIIAEGNDNTALQHLRLDRIASDIILGLFDGLVRRVVFREPAETLHFGIELDESGDHKLLKYAETGPQGQQPGDVIAGVRVEVPMRDPARRVLDVQTLANGSSAATSIHQALIANQGIAPQADYTSAEFSLEMIQGVQRVDYTISSPLTLVGAESESQVRGAR